MDKRSPCYWSRASAMVISNADRRARALACLALFGQLLDFFTSFPRSTLFVHNGTFCSTRRRNRLLPRADLVRRRRREREERASEQLRKNT